MNRQPSAMDRVAKARPAALDPAPDTERRMADLARALAEPSSSSGEVEAGRSGPARTLPHRPRLILGLAAAAAVAAVAVLITTSGFGPTEPVADSPTTDLNASRTLLVAADRVATAPATGRYWRSTTETYSLELAGPQKDPYRIQSRDRSQDWISRSDSSPSWGGNKSLGRKPVSAADRAAWQRDGSPTTLTIREPIDGGVMDVPAAGTKWAAGWGNPDSKVFFVGHDMTMSAIRALPSDLTRLREFLMTDFQRSVEASRTFPQNGTWTRDGWLFNTASSLLTLPVTPEVRASAYRIMANLNGVRSLGKMPDLTGRVGDAVAVQGNNRLGRYEKRIIIDPDSGLMLADETRYLKPIKRLSWVKPTDIWQSTVILDIGWTNDKPPARTK